MKSESKPGAAQEAEAWGVYAKSDEYPDPFLIPEYAGSRSVIRSRVMEKARSEGFIGDFDQRIAELGWWLEPLFRAAPVAAAPVESREQAINLARESALAHSTQHSYLPQSRNEARDWQPHEWVVTAIQAAALPSTPAAPGIDLEQFREAVEHWKRDLHDDYKGGHIHDGGEAMRKAEHLLALIDASPKGGSDALSRAYGYLWHVNHPEDIPAGHPFMSADRAAVEARKELRDILTHEQRGEGINWVRQKLLAAMQPTSAEVGA